LGPFNYFSGIIFSAVTFSSFHLNVNKDESLRAVFQWLSGVYLFIQARIKFRVEKSSTIRWNPESGRRIVGLYKEVVFDLRFFMKMSEGRSMLFAYR
jgi:hypothetical protein